jgi:hypothetical protein
VAGIDLFLHWCRHRNLKPDAGWVHSAHLVLDVFILPGDDYLLRDNHDTGASGKKE